MLWKPIADEWSATEAPRWRIVAHEPHTALGAAGAVVGAGLLLTLFADGVPATMETIAFPLVAYGCVTAMGVSEVLKRFAGTWDREARFEKDAIVVTDNKGRTRRIDYAEIAHADFTVPVPNTGKLKCPTLVLSSSSEKKLLEGNVASGAAYRGLKAELDARKIRVVAPVWAEESYEARKL